MSENTLPAFDFPAVGRKKVVAAFDGGRLTSDGGVMLLSAVERELDISRSLAALIPDTRTKYECRYPISNGARGFRDCGRDPGVRSG